MKAPLFEFPSYQYDIKDWEFKKKGLLSRINKSKFIRTKLQTFETDRQTCEKSYVRYIEEFLQPELSEFCQEAQVSCSVSDAWCVKYQKEISRQFIIIKDGDFLEYCMWSMIQKFILLLVL